MTKAQMQSLVTALTNAGYVARLVLNQDGSWTVRSNSNTFDVDVTAVKNLATNQGIGAFVAEVEYR